MKNLFLALFLVLSMPYARAFIPWENLKNPVYQHENWSVKDATMVYHEPSGHFYLFFSAFFESQGRIRSHISGVKTKDFINFSEPLFVWHGEEIGYKGFAAPEVTFLDGKYIMTYNSWGDRIGKFNQLFYAVSTDLENWDKHRPLARNITRNARVIDVALTKIEEKYVINYKIGYLMQRSRMAVADSIDGPWKIVGRPFRDWMENGQFIEIDGNLHMMMTADKSHTPHLTRWLNTGKKPLLSWEPLRRIEIPLEGFNTHDRANAGHLKDWRKYDGYFYLLYAGTTESESYIGRGDNRLGLARSKDLINWEIP